MRACIASFGASNHALWCCLVISNPDCFQQDPNHRNGLVAKEKDKHLKVIPDSNVMESDTAIIDVNEYMEPDDYPLPSFVTQTEAMLEEMESMVRMEIEELLLFKTVI